MMVPKVGVEPTRVLSPADFESAASASSATSAFVFVATLILTERKNGVNMDALAGIINRNKGSSRRYTTPAINGLKITNCYREVHPDNCV